MDFSPLIISLETALTATVVTFFLGIGLAYGVVRLRYFQGIADAIITLPMVLPPTVVGFFLLLFLGRKSAIGQFLLQFDINLVFTWQAAVIAAVIVSLPLMYRTARGAFEQLDVNILNAARTLGISEWRIFWRILLPNSWQGILAGVVLSFTRALGEFGATAMLAGNIAGKTQTLPLAIYSEVAAGKMSAAYQYVWIIVVISFLVVVLMNVLAGKEKRK